MSNDPFGSGLFVGAMTTFIVCAIVFIAVSASYDVYPRSVWEKEAVKNNAGEYNNKTGKFQWVTIKPESVCE